MIRLKLFYAVTWYLHGQEIRTLYQAAEIGDLRGAVAALDKGADVNLECLVLINYMFSHFFFTILSCMFRFEEGLYGS